MTRSSLEGFYLQVLIFSFFSALAFLFNPITVTYSNAKASKVLVLTDAAGLGDKGFNDVCWQGVQRAKSDFGLEAQFIQSREQADYEANIALAAQSSDIVITLGYLFVDALKNTAPQFPATRFIHIEGDIPGENIASFDFRSEEGGFLAGLVAGLFSKSRTVGAVSGMDIPPVEAYLSGFKAGIKTAEKARGGTVEAIIASAGSFNDPIKGKSLARTLIDKGADVLFRVAGNTGVGVMKAVKESEAVYLIGEDLDQDGEIPGRVLTSTLKRMDVAVYGALREIVEGKFHAGHRWLGVPDGAIDITDMPYTRELFDPKDMERIQRARSLLKEGKISIPKRCSDVVAFQPPDL